MKYISGPELTDALETNSTLEKLNFRTTIGYWNINSDKPNDVTAMYTKAMERLSGKISNPYLSIKAPAFDFDHKLYSIILESSRLTGVPIHFDSLEPSAADKTLELIKGATEVPYGIIGYTLPGRWERSLLDADTAIALGLKLRVVKGQWADPNNPNLNPRSGFLSVVERLAGKARHVQIATHDPELAKESFRRLLDTNTPCELEVLYGLPLKPVIEVALSFKIPVRMYVPYGYGFIPYSISALRQPRTFWWLVRDSFSGSYIKRIPRLTHTEGFTCKHIS